MATLSLNITVPNNKAADILDTITDILGYDPASVDPKYVGLNRAQFLKLQIRDHLKDLYKRGKEKEASTAVHQAGDEADAVDFT